MYEKLIKEVEKENIRLIEMGMAESIKGLYCDNCIAINKKIPTNRVNKKRPRIFRDL